MHVYTQIDIVKLNILGLILIFAALPHALPPTQFQTSAISTPNMGLQKGWLN